ncbi:MAG: hypothetical protein GX992_06275 [Clostridium sp.]|nr:hypothetical protein [Clostridium sp.]
MKAFIEKMVKRKKNVQDGIIIVGTIVLATILMLLTFIVIGPHTVSLFICVGIGFGAYFVILSRRIEFEYLFTSERLVIDKIINRKRRRNIITSDCSEIEIIAKADSAKFEHYVTQAKKKISAVSSMDSKDIYFFIVNRTIDGKINKILVLFEPDERMLKSIRAAVPRKFSDQT